jgi:hypothetical protein
MKPPRPSERDTAATRRRLRELSATFGAGRILELLRRNELTRNTAEELLRPENAAKLRAIVTSHLFPAAGVDDPGPGDLLGRFPSEGGKVLVFKAKEAFRS